MNQYKQAFTLIELLVVVAIIGIISSIVVTSLESARTAAQDANRIAKIDQLQLALEQYFADNGYYPQVQHGLGVQSIASCNDDLYGETYESTWGHCGRWRILQEELSPYISLKPGDYTESQQGLYYFNYTSQSDDWTKYGLEVRLAQDSDLARNDGGVRSDWYEVGQSPAYCTSKYTGGDSEWLQKSGTFGTVCAGGN